MSHDGPGVRVTLDRGRGSFPSAGIGWQLRPDDPVGRSGPKQQPIIGD